MSTVVACIILWTQLPLSLWATSSNSSTQINQSVLAGAASSVTTNQKVETSVAGLTTVEQHVFSSPYDDIDKVSTMAVATLGPEHIFDLDQINNDTDVEMQVETVESASQLMSKIQIDPEELRSLLKVDINHLIEQWREAWETGDAERYLGFYSAQFTPVGGVSVQAWQGQRRLRVVPSRQINVSLRDFYVVFGDANQSCVVRFEQTYMSDTYNDVSIKELTLVKDGEWRIVAEAAVD